MPMPEEKSKRNRVVEGRGGEEVLHEKRRIFLKKIIFKAGKKRGVSINR